MPHSAASSRRSASADEDVAAVLDEPASAAPWLAVVSNKVKSLRYGIVQIVVHDSKVVQIEQTERTRFEVPQSTGPR